MSLLQKSRFWLIRSFTATFGILSIAWVLFSLPTYRAEVPLGDFVRRALVGESYNAEQLSSLQRQLDAIPAKRLRSSALNDVAVLRLRLVESKLATGNQNTASDLAELETLVTAALAESPSSSFLWLVEYWLRNIGGHSVDSALTLLQMSYLSGPNEGWIAIRRNPLALKVFPSLPPEIADQVLSEFAGLVRSRLFQEASNILAGPGWAVRQKLLGRLVRIDENYRFEFARVLASNKVEGALVPGTEANERPPRPF